MSSRFTRAEKERIAAAWRDPSVLQDPVELHALALNWNWDGVFDPLLGIIRHPLCDRGTALLVYWYASPEWLYKTYADEEEIEGEYERQRYRMVKEVEQRYLGGFYTNARIRFDPETDWKERFPPETLKQPVPPVMLMPSPGRRLSTARLWLDCGW